MSSGTTDTNAASRLRLEAQLRNRQREPMEEADAVRAAYYAEFDRAVATLPPDQADRVDLHSSYADDDGTWILRDVAAQLVAKVLDPDAPKPEPVKAVAKPAQGFSPQQRKLLIACAKKVNELDETVADLIHKFAYRLDALETQNAIDAEVVAELEKVTERVEAIETRGFRFVGKYQAPATYKAGDVVAYKDALWNCVQDAKAGDRPNTASHKWTLMLSGVNE